MRLCCAPMLLPHHTEVCLSLGAAAPVFLAVSSIPAFSAALRRLEVHPRGPSSRSVTAVVFVAELAVVVAVDLLSIDHLLGEVDVNVDLPSCAARITRDLREVARRWRTLITRAAGNVPPASQPPEAMGPALAPTPIR